MPKFSIRSSIVVPTNSEMSSIQEQLKAFRESQQKSTDQYELIKIQKMSLEELSAEKIAFGKAKIGQPFEKVFQDAAWTDWFVQTYEKSPKPAHQLYIKYVEKRLNAEITEDIQKNKANTKGAKLIPKTAQGSEMTAAEVTSWDEISEPDLTQEFELPGISKLNQVEDQVSSLHLQNQNLVNRMTQMEMTMQELLQHIRGLSVKAEP